MSHVDVGDLANEVALVRTCDCYRLVILRVDQGAQLWEDLDFGVLCSWPRHGPVECERSWRVLEAVAVLLEWFCPGIMAIEVTLCQGVCRWDVMLWWWGVAVRSILFLLDE